MSETRPEIWIPVVVGVVVMLIFIYYCYIKNEEAALRQHQGYIIEKGGGYRRRRGYFPPPPPRRTGLGPLGFAGGDPGDDGNGPPAAGFWGLGGGPPRGGGGGGGGGGGCGIMGPGPCARVTRSGRSPFSPSRSRSRAMHPGWYGFRRDSEGPGGRRAWDDLPPLPFGFGGGGGGRAGVGMPWTERMLPRRGRGGPWGGGRDGDDDDYDIIERGPAFP